MKYKPVTDLAYFLEWRPYLWKPAIEWLIQDPSRFAGKRVLDLGCRSGKMSCFFGLLGARVTGIDLSIVNMDNARQEARKWNLSEVVDFKNYDGNPKNLDKNEYDFIFTKSVLVIIPNLDEFLIDLLGCMKINGELISAENTKINPFVTRIISKFTGNKLRQKKTFHGVDSVFLSSIERNFGALESKEFYGLVTGIRATLFE